MKLTPPPGRARSRSRSPQYHAEHHAWPNVPFYKLPELHRRVAKAGTRPRSGCTPEGERGYVHLHRVLSRLALGARDKL